jgi:hypothetical protein
MRVTRGPVDCDLPRQSGWTPEVRKEGETLGYCSKEHMYGGQKAKVSEPQRWQRIEAVGQMTKESCFCYCFVTVFIVKERQTPNARSSKSPKPPYV